MLVESYGDLPEWQDWLLQHQAFLDDTKEFCGVDEGEAVDVKEMRRAAPNLSPKLTGRPAAPRGPELRPGRPAVAQALGNRQYIASSSMTLQEY